MGKIKREDVRRSLEEDVVVETGRRLWRGFQEHQNFFVTLILVAAVLWLAVQLFGRYRANQIAMANYKLAQAQSSFMRGMRASDVAERDDWLAQSDQLLAPVVDSASPLGRRAMYLSGVTRFHQLQFAEARERFATYAQSTEDPVDRARGELAVGACYENESFMEGDDALLQPALESFRKAVELGGSSYVKYQAMIAEARVLGRSDETRAEAIERLEAVIEHRQALIDEATPGTLEDMSPSRLKTPPPEPLTLVETARNDLERLQAQAQTRM